MYREMVLVRSHDEASIFTRLRHTARVCRSASTGSRRGAAFEKSPRNRGWQSTLACI